MFSDRVPASPRLITRGAVSTQAWGINTRGDVVGFYTLADTSTHGFLLSGGNFTPIDYPGAAVTFLYGINSGGDIVGESASTLTGTHHGFLRSSAGNYTSVEYPGSTYTGGAAITPRGDIVGEYTLPDNSNHPFLLRGDRFSTFEYPGATTSLGNGINRSGRHCWELRHQRRRDPRISAERRRSSLQSITRRYLHRRVWDQPARRHCRAVSRCRRRDTWLSAERGPIQHF